MLNPTRDLRRFVRATVVAMMLMVFGSPATVLGQKPTAKKNAKVEKKAAKVTGDSATVLSGRIRALQLRPFLKRGRFFIQGASTFSINDPLMYHIGVGGSLGIHLSERHALSARFFVFRNIESGVREQLKTEINLFPERTDLRMEGQLVYSFSPIDGKFAFFGAGIAYFDFYLNLGGGIIQNFNNAYRPAGLVGAGIRLYLSDWLAMNCEINDTIYLASFPQGSSVLQNVSLGLGLSVYMPFSPNYRSLK